MRLQFIPAGWRVGPVLLLVLGLAMPALPALAQDAGAVISIDSPTDGTTAAVGQDIVFIGWAAQAGGAGTGIDRVVILDAPLAAGGQQIAQAQYGQARTDVGAQYGAAWTNSEFKATWKATGSAGNRTFWIYAHSPADDGWTNKTVTVRLTDGAATSTSSRPTGRQGTGSMPSSQYGTQTGALTTPQSGQSSALTIPQGGQYGAPQYNAPQSLGSQYGPGSPNGAVPIAPFSTQQYGLGSNYAWPGGMYGGSPYGGMYGGSPFGGGYGGSPYGGYPGGLPYNAGYGAPGLPYGGYGAGAPYGGVPYAGAYGGYPGQGAYCTGGLPFGANAGYASYGIGSGNYYAGSGC